MRLVRTLALFLLICPLAIADDLYKVEISSAEDAELLRQTGVTTVAPLQQGYLILVDFEAAEYLQSTELQYELLSTGIDFDQLAIDRRRDRVNVAKYNLLFEEDDFRLYHVTGPKTDFGPDGLWRLPESDAPIKYTPPTQLNRHMAFGDVDLDSLISLIDQDTVRGWNEHLEAYPPRVAGRASNHEAASWIADKFVSFGYDSVYFDSFMGEQLWSYNSVQCMNVVATKVGTRYPDKYIVIGGHFDAVPDCPGADDNASGTVGTMAIAKVLADIETDMTLVYIAFDSEESGLHGSDHYADEAYEREDEIVFMLNMDMIGHYTNDADAALYHGPEVVYAQLWGALADSLVGITGHPSGGSGGSDQIQIHDQRQT